jgi:putative addiction module component (TIGR02574 family)
MARDLRELEEELAQLTTQEKAAVARSLIDALDEKWDEDVERCWMEEAERRYAAYRRGEVKTSLASDVFSRIRERLRK